MLGSSGDGYAPFEQHPSLKASITPRHDDPGVDFAALHLSSEEDEAFPFRT